MARDSREAVSLLESFPGARVLRIFEPEGDWPKSGNLQICLCALGPVHPIEPEPLADLKGVERDLTALERLVEGVGTGVSRCVLISSVLALAPRAERAYYAGWKSLLAPAVERILSSCSDSTLSVLHPGRLIERRRASAPETWLATTYAALAEVVSESLDRPRRSVVGPDARLWLMSRTLVHIRSALSSAH